MTIKGVIFDVDGVLLDTVPYHFKAWKALFDEYHTLFTFDDYLSKVNGLPRAVGIQNILPALTSKELDNLAAKKQKYFLDLVRNGPPKPLHGVLPLFHELQKMDILLAAASSSKNAPFLLKQVGLTDFLSAIVGGADFSKSKPNPELFLIAAQKLQVDPQQCIVIEDASIGIQAAKNANMKTIGLLHSQDTSIQEIADFTVNSLSDYKTIINFINAENQSFEQI